MIEKLTNCPNCGGYLNDSGRCEFCGSKVYDFLAIDFNPKGMPSAKTYIRIKANGGTVIAPVIINTVSMEIPNNVLHCADISGECGYIQAPAYPIFNVEFVSVGKAITIESEETD